MPPAWLAAIACLAGAMIWQPAPKKIAPARAVKVCAGCGVNNCLEDWAWSGLWGCAVTWSYKLGPKSGGPDKIKKNINRWN